MTHEGDTAMRADNKEGSNKKSETNGIKKHRNGENKATSIVMMSLQETEPALTVI